jgi:hypothetical protein
VAFEHAPVSAELYFCSTAILTSLTAQAPYVESLMIRYVAVAALTGPHWIDTSVLDFGLRWIFAVLNSPYLTHLTAGIFIKVSQKSASIMLPIRS